MTSFNLPCSDSLGMEAQLLKATNKTAHKPMEKIKDMITTLSLGGTLITCQRKLLLIWCAGSAEI